MKKQRVVAYVRVSTKKKQEGGRETQIDQINKYCEANGLTVSEWVFERESARQVVLEERDRMISDVEKKKFDVVIVVALDRLSRESNVQSLVIVDRIYRAGADLISLAQPFLNQFVDPGMKTFMVSVFGLIASEESKSLSRRIKAGMARAKKEGQTFGRRAKSEVGLAKAVERFKAGGISINQVARDFNVPKTSVLMRLRRQGFPTGPVTNSLESDQSTAA